MCDFENNAHPDARLSVKGPVPNDVTAPDGYAAVSRCFSYCSRIKALLGIFSDLVLR